MDNKFKVTVNENMSFDLTEQDLTNIDNLTISDTTAHILQENKPFTVVFVDSNFNRKKYTLLVNNNRYEVDISDRLDLLINEMGFALGSVKDIASIEAPMPGLILEINVKEGQEVSEDDPLLILEAMKMENVITSPRNGVIKHIAVTKGEAVEKNRLLIEFE